MSAFKQNYSAQLYAQTTIRMCFGINHKTESLGTGYKSPSAC